MTDSIILDPQEKAIAERQCEGCRWWSWFRGCFYDLPNSDSSQPIADCKVRAPRLRSVFGGTMSSQGKVEWMQDKVIETPFDQRITELEDKCRLATETLTDRVGLNDLIYRRSGFRLGHGSRDGEVERLRGAAIRLLTYCPSKDGDYSTGGGSDWSRNFAAATMNMLATLEETRHE
ncbi:hypothetical protein LCGC14_1964700, partial [marine sediment metagenome]